MSGLIRLISAVFLILMAASALPEPLKEPFPSVTALERFANHRNSRVVPIYDSPRISAADGWIEIKSVSVRNKATQPKERTAIREEQ